MNELQQILQIVREFKRTAILVEYAVHNQLPSPITTDFHELIDDIKYLEGYIECMVKFKLGFHKNPSISAPSSV